MEGSITGYSVQGLLTMGTCIEFREPGTQKLGALAVGPIRGTLDWYPETPISLN